jgi:hypothetical protein
MVDARASWAAGARYAGYSFAGVEIEAPVVRSVLRKVKPEASVVYVSTVYRPRYETVIHCCDSRYALAWFASTHVNGCAGRPLGSDWRGCLLIASKAAVEEERPLGGAEGVLDFLGDG